MFGKNKNELNVPGLAKDKDSYEVLRVWSDKNYSSQFVVGPKWEDPAVWGITLADMVKKISEVHAKKHGGDAKAIQGTITSMLTAELDRVDKATDDKLSETELASVQVEKTTVEAEVDYPAVEEKLAANAR